MAITTDLALNNVNYGSPYGFMPAGTSPNVPMQVPSTTQQVAEGIGQFAPKAMFRTEFGGNLMKSAEGFLPSGAQFNPQMPGFNQAAQDLFFNPVGKAGPMPKPPGQTIGSTGITASTALNIGGNVVSALIPGGTFSIGDGSAQNAAIGKTVGTLAGNFIPIPFVGPIIGGAVGEAVGSLFGSQPNPISEFGAVLNQDFATVLNTQGTVTNTGPNTPFFGLGSKHMGKEFGASAYSQLEPFFKNLQSAGVNPYTGGFLKGGFESFYSGGKGFFQYVGADDKESLQRAFSDDRTAGTSIFFDPENQEETEKAYQQIMTEVLRNSRGTNKATNDTLWKLKQGEASFEDTIRELGLEVGNLNVAETSQYRVRNEPLIAAKKKSLTQRPFEEFLEDYRNKRNMISVER